MAAPPVTQQPKKFSPSISGGGGSDKSRNRFSVFGNEREEEKKLGGAENWGSDLKLDRIRFENDFRLSTEIDPREKVKSVSAEIGNELKMGPAINFIIDTNWLR